MLQGAHIGQIAESHGNVEFGVGKTGLYGTICSPPSK